MTLLSEDRSFPSLWQRVLSRFDEHDAMWKRGSLLCLLAVVPFVIGSFLGLYRWHADDAVSQREQTAIATVTREISNRAYEYQFSANGQVFRGSSPPEQALSVGHEMTIYYDPLDPNTNSHDDYADLKLTWLGVAMFCIAISTPVVFVVVRNRRRLT